MGKLFNWLMSAVAIATTAYILNTYTISKTNNGLNFKGPKSDTTITYNSGTTEFRNSYNSPKGNIETRLGKDNNGFFGSINDTGNSISGIFDNKNRKGNLSSNIGNLLGWMELDYDPTRSNTFNQWISGFEGLNNNNYWNYKRL